MKISKKSQYGLRAMIYLGKNPEKIFPLKSISKAEGIPLDFLEKIISKLKKARLVKSKKGIGGGYFLAKEPKKIQVGKIIEALEGRPKLVACLQYFCPREKECSAKIFWQKLDKAINLTLNSLTLFDLIKRKHVKSS